MTRLIGLALMSLIISMIITGFTKKNEEEKQMENDSIVLSITKALKMADNKAHELGYKPESYYISITDKLRDVDKLFLSKTEQEYALWIIYYEPKGKLTFGGDLTIYINRQTDTILKVWQGE